MDLVYGAPLYQSNDLKIYNFSLNFQFLYNISLRAETIMINEAVIMTCEKKWKMNQLTMFTWFFSLYMI